MKQLLMVMGLWIGVLGARDIGWKMKEGEASLLGYRQMYQLSIPWEVFQAQLMIQEYLEQAQSSLDPEVLRMEQEAIRLRDPYGSMRAKVRMGSDISSEERALLRERMHRVKKGVRRFAGLDQPLEDAHVPRIAICGSGGGIRASLSTLGSLIGALEIGLLDTVLYGSALSGSAWLMGSIFSDSQDDHDYRVLYNYKDKLIRQLYKGLSISVNPLNVKLATENLLTKFYYGQRLSLVDFWGFIIGEMMLKNLGQYWPKALLSSQSMLMETGAYPFPIYTTIMPMGDGKFEWFEISPFEVWSEFLQMSIPTWSFGRKFKKGVSLDYAPEHSLGYYLGVFGSAFELDLTDFMRHMGKHIKDPILKGLVQILLKTSMKDLRLSPAEFRNFAYGMKGAPLADKKMLTLIDAGIDFNLPAPPLLRKSRDIDVIIFLDSSTAIEGGRELKSIQKYAQKRNIPLPTITTDDVHLKTISVFDDNIDAPICVYMPRIKNEQYDTSFDPIECAQSDFCHTFNFEYNEQQANQLCGLTHANMKENKETLQNVVREAIRRRKAKIALQESMK